MTSQPTNNLICVDCGLVPREVVWLERGPVCADECRTRRDQIAATLAGLRTNASREGTGAAVDTSRSYPDVAQALTPPTRSPVEADAPAEATPTDHCSRCGKDLGKRHNWDAKFTSGYYVVAGEYWGRFARPGELFVCDACMMADPRFTDEPRVARGVSMPSPAVELAILTHALVARPETGSLAYDRARVALFRLAARVSQLEATVARTERRSHAAVKLAIRAVSERRAEHTARLAAEQRVEELEEQLRNANAGG